MQKPCVRGNEVACFKVNDIADDKLGSVNYRLHSVSYHTSVGSRHIFESVESFFCFALLDYTHHGVENYDKKNERGFKKLAPIFLYAYYHEGYYCRENEYEYHHVLELLEEALQGCLFLFFTELVWSVLGKKPRCFCRIKTASGIRIQLGKYFGFTFVMKRQFKKPPQNFI